jgi:hypothetical protein
VVGILTRRLKNASRDEEVCGKGGGIRYVITYAAIKVQKNVSSCELKMKSFTSRSAETTTTEGEERRS